MATLAADLRAFERLLRLGKFNAARLARDMHWTEDQVLYQLDVLTHLGYNVKRTTACGQDFYWIDSSHAIEAVV